MKVRSDHISKTATQTSSVYGEQQHQQLLLNLSMHPNRSLGKKGFRRLMLFFCAIGLLASFRFIAVGAWPVVPFIAIDILAIWLAFYLNNRAGRFYEEVILTKTALRISRTLPNGSKEEWCLEPYWASVKLEEDTHHTHIILKSNQTKLSLGYYLSDPEKHEIAKEIDAALSRWKATAHA